MKKVALVTGASSGIGKELAFYHASQGGDLVLVARREDVLHNIKQNIETKYGVKVLVLPVDLSNPKSAAEIYRQTKKENIFVETLINNAGFGTSGKFHKQDLSQNLNMIQVNVSSLVSLSHFYLQDMVEKDKGQILNVASVAAFLPGPRLACYYATKAFVLSFSQALNEELSQTKVSVTAVCPGPVDTEFADTADLNNVKIFDRAASAESVARCGYLAMQNKKIVKITDPKMSFLLNWIVPFAPRRLLLKISQKMMMSR